MIHVDIKINQKCLYLSNYPAMKESREAIAQIMVFNRGLMKLNMIFLRKQSKGSTFADELDRGARV